MLTVDKLVPQGRGIAPPLLRRATSVTLDWDTRQRSRFAAEDTSGRELAVFLPRGRVVRGGDVLVCDDGSLVVVRAADEPVLVVRPCGEHGTPFDLLRAAYHLGNRHVMLELKADHLKLEPDPVLADLLRAMHLDVEETRAPFEPEGGAYAPAAHGHDHHDHDH
jgi:urease accessory protein